MNGMQYYRIRPPRVFQQDGGSYIHEPIGGDRIRIKHDPHISNKNVINLVMERYPEPEKDPEADIPDEPGPELAVDAATQEPSIDVPESKIPQPSYPISLPFQNQQSVLSLTKRDHDDIVASVNQSLRQSVSAAIPGARLAGAAAQMPEEYMDLMNLPVSRLKSMLQDLVDRHGIPPPQLLNQVRPNKKFLVNEIRSVGLQHGYGARSGTSTDDLEDLCQKIGLRHIRVIPSDRVKDLKLDRLGRLAFIMNLDDSSQPGSHWVSANIDSEHGKFIEYYDSLGNKPTKDFLQQVKTLVGTSKSLLKLKTNRIADQSINSSNCGYFAVKFLKDRITNGQSFAQASGFSTKATAGERRIEKFKIKYL